MGMPSAQVQPGTQPQSKGFAQSVNPPAQNTTNAATSGQPTFGQPNMYPNTVGQWDNASIQRRPSSGKGTGMGQQSPTGGGKGKG